MQVLLTLLIGILGGLLFEAAIMAFLEIVHHKPIRVTRKFSFAKKVSMFTLPIWGLLAVLARYNMQYWWFFLLSAIVGTTFEFSIGLFFQTAFKTKLWTYRHGQLGAYTSIYSIPIWGGGGIVFLAIAKLLGV